VSTALVRDRVICFCRECSRHYREGWRGRGNGETYLRHEEAVAARLGGSTVVAVRCWNCFMKDPGEGVREDMRRSAEDWMRLQSLRRGVSE
jgi:hypothetical protein